MATHRTVYMIQSSSGDFSDELRVLDLSGSADLVALEDCLTQDFQEAIDVASKTRSMDKDAWRYQMNRSPLSPVLNIYDTSDGGRVAAELDMSILGHWGTWKLSLRDRPDEVTLRRVGVFTKEETFNIDGVNYRWDMTGGRKQGKLYSEAKEGRRQVAQFVARGWFRNRCIVATNCDELDDLVVLGTCVAALNRDI